MKYSLEQKCEWNLFVLWLFLATVKFCMVCLDRVVLAHPFWTLATLPACSFVLSCWTNRTPSVPLSLSFFTFVWEAGCFQGTPREAGCFQGTPIALSALQYVCWHFHYQPSFKCVVLLFLLPAKADTYFYNSSSFVVNWDISASTVHMHLHKQQQSNWRIVSKSKALLILYKCIPSQACPEHYSHY